MTLPGKAEKMKTLPHQVDESAADKSGKNAGEKARGKAVAVYLHNR